METLDYFRLFNIFIATLAFTVNLLKMHHLKFYKTMGPDSMMGFLALMSWCLAFSVAGAIAAAHDVKTGIWTVIMGIPCWWTLTAGLWGWSPAPERK